jgi:3alpha(or 20beta)-hydroxysteroid dehydrogenase
LSVLEGKVAIVTGAAKGQGEAEARLFAAEGAKVVLTDIDMAGEAVAAAIGAQAVFVRHDVADASAWRRVVETAIVRFGHVDVLVNNAGVYKPASVQNTDEALIDFHYRINQLGVFLGMQAVIAPMTAAGGGSIVNIASGAGLAGIPGCFAYAATKWAVRGMTKAAAMDLGALKIRVNAVHPGPIDTAMLHSNNSPAALEAARAHTPLGRVGTPEEIARVACFLASDASSYMTGADVAVTGGLLS